MPYADPREAKAKRLDRYRADPEKAREKARRQYERDPEPARARALAARQRRRDELSAQVAEAERLRLATIPEPVPYDGAPGRWLARAACAGMDTELFFQQQASREVRGTCVACPVRAECLGMALAFPGMRLHGFWGGTSHHERQRLRAQARDTAMTHETPTAAVENPQVGASRVDCC